jgi:hypothetical protein
LLAKRDCLDYPAEPPEWKVLAKLESRVYDHVVAEAPDMTAAQARAALDEAGIRLAQVRRNDRQLSWMLLLVAAAYLGVGAVMSLSLRHGTPFAPAAVIVTLVAAIGAAVVIALRIPAYSRAGIIRYFSTIIAFNLWNAAVISASIATRFWASGQPGYHFGVSVAIAVIPLLAGAWLLVRR